MVAGHSVTISGHLEDAGLDETDWYLLDYQRGHGLPQAIVAHITAGIQQARQDPDALLIFSGGETRPITGPLAEGSSYFHVADAMNLWNIAESTGSEAGGAAAAAAIVSKASTNTVRARTVTEEFATDSFENLYVLDEAALQVRNPNGMEKCFVSIHSSPLPAQSYFFVCYFCDC
jgi:hypothetical protein